ncbi:MAG: efflux RND transporter permease subunit, partial [Myxococcota bacterium]
MRAETSSAERSGLIAWFARNSVAANLLMLALLIGGAAVSLDIKQEVFPSFQLDFVDIEMRYPGASPEEIEDAIVLPIEEQLRGLEVAERIVAEAREGTASVAVELIDGVDP